MRPYSFIASVFLTAIVACLMSGAAFAGQQNPPNAPKTLKASKVSLRKVTQETLRAQATLIAETEVALWRCQDQLGVTRTRVGTPPWSLPRSVAYRAWVTNLWRLRRASCLDTLHQRAEVWRRLQRGLQGSPMAGTERELEIAGRRHHVSPYFIAAIAATESSLGAAMCGNYNAWGLGNCTGIWNVPAFGSWAEAYDFMGRFLHERWPNARTPYDYHGYAACTSCWGAKTASHMARLFGVAASVSYR